MSVDDNDALRSAVVDADRDRAFVADSDVERDREALAESCADTDSDERVNRSDAVAVAVRGAVGDSVSLAAPVGEFELLR